MPTTPHILTFPAGLPQTASMPGKFSATSHFPQTALETSPHRSSAARRVVGGSTPFSSPRMRDIHRHTVPIQRPSCRRQGPAGRQAPVKDKNVLPVTERLGRCRPGFWCGVAWYAARIWLSAHPGMPRGSMGRRHYQRSICHHRHGRQVVQIYRVRHFLVAL